MNAITLIGDSIEGTKIVSNEENKKMQLRKQTKSHRNAKMS
jgi:hypothetical protein